MSSVNGIDCDNIPPACEQIFKKLDILSTAALSHGLSSEQVLSIKQKLCSEISELKHTIKLEQDYLKSVKDDLAVCKDKINFIDKWEEGITNLDAVLPVVNKPANHGGNNGNHTSAAHHQTVSSGVTLCNTGTNKDGLPAFRNIDEAEWVTVPSYLKLRLKLEQVNEFVRSLNKELTEKYTLLKKKKSTLKKSEMTLRAYYVGLEIPETKGLYFVVTSDLKKMGLPEKTISTMSSILRHCHRLREVRNGKTIRLIVTN